MNRIRLIALVALVVAVAACARSGAPSSQAGDASESPPTMQPQETAAASAIPEPTKGGVMTGDVPEDILGRILADAADRSGLPEDELELARAEAVTWNDGSLGCPEPGMMYTQALVDGYWVVVEAEGEEIDYRVDRTGGFRVCENPDPASG